MSTLILITICTLLLLSYLFEISSKWTKIPTVVFLLLLGWTVRQIAKYIGLEIPDYSPILPILGTIGLILIVLEGALELDFNSSKSGLVKKSMLGSMFAIFASAGILTFLFMHYGNYSLKTSLINALPLCVISSAIAIPSAKNLKKSNKEFVIYESSFSDIIGVLFFNFIALNQSYDVSTFGFFGLELISIIVVSIVSTLGLAYLLRKIDHQIKFFPIIILIILIYAVSKYFHLPGLVFILLFGLIMGNIKEIKKLKWIKKYNTEKLEIEVEKFKDLNIEATFIVRSMFFLLFGFLIRKAEIFNTDTLVWSIGITALIFAVRAIQLLFSKLPFFPLLFIAPRGLITILLFLSIYPEDSIAIVNKSLIIQVVLFTAFILMFGLLFAKRHTTEKKVTI